MLPESVPQAALQNVWKAWQKLLRELKIKGLIRLPPLL